MVRITRKTTCVTLDLPHDLVCRNVYSNLRNLYISVKVHPPIDALSVRVTQLYQFKVLLFENIIVNSKLVEEANCVTLCTEKAHRMQFFLYHVGSVIYMHLIHCLHHLYTMHTFLIVVCLLVQIQEEIIHHWSIWDSMNQNIVDCGFMEREEEMDIWREKKRRRGGGKVLLFFLFMLWSADALET